MYTHSKGRNVAVTSYCSLLPKKKECGNLLACCAVSSSLIAFESIRMEPVFMSLGQSVATATVQALEVGNDLHYLDYQNLRDQLIRDGQKLEVIMIKIRHCLLMKNILYTENDIPVNQ